MDEQMEEVARKVRELGDLRHQASVDQCELLGHYWGDREALSALAKELEAGEAKLKKWAGAGAVYLAGYWDGELKPVEWAYQLSLFRKVQWSEVADWDALGDLSASDLKALRMVDEKLRVSSKRLTIEDVE